MNPAAARLARSLARAGQDVTLRRLTGTTNQVPVDVKVRAHVRGYQPHELVGGIAAGDSRVTISMVEIDRWQWPGGVAEGSERDERLPRAGDRVVIDGRARKVEWAEPIWSGGEVVRVNMLVRGS